MAKCFVVVVLLIAFCSKAQFLYKTVDSLGCKDSLVIKLHSPKLEMEFNKPRKKPDFTFFFDRAPKVLYRDNFTNRLYFQNGFDRSVVIPK